MDSAHFEESRSVAWHSFRSERLHRCKGVGRVRLAKRMLVKVVDFLVPRSIIPCISLTEDKLCDDRTAADQTSYKPNPLQDMQS